MRINADDDASIDVYTKDGKRKICTINCFDLTEYGEGLRGCIDVIPASKTKANALAFRFNADQAEPTFDGGQNGRYRMTSPGLVAVEIR